MVVKEADVEQVTVAEVSPLIAVVSVQDTEQMPVDAAVIVTSVVSVADVAQTPVAVARKGSNMAATVMQTPVAAVIIVMAVVSAGGFVAQTPDEIDLDWIAVVNAQDEEQMPEQAAII